MARQSKGHSDVGNEDATGVAHTIRALVYVEESSASSAVLTATGYRATITLRGGVIEAAVIVPLSTARRWPVSRGTRVWHCVEAFIAALPSLRHHAPLGVERKSA